MQHRDDHGATQHRAHARRRPHLRSGGSCRRRAHTSHTAAPSLGGGSCTDRSGGRRLSAGSLRRSSGRLGAGTGYGHEHVVGSPPSCPQKALTGTVGEAVETGAALLAGGTCIARAAAAQPTGATELVQGAPGVTGAGCKGLGFRHLRVWPPTRRGPHPSPLLTMAVRVAVMALAAAVTSGPVKLRPAGAAASLVTALRQSPCGAAATHCGGQEAHGVPEPGRPRPGSHAHPAHRGGLAHAGRGGSGSSQEHSGHTRSPRSLLGTCTGPSLGRRFRPPLRGWNTGTLRGGAAVRGAGTLAGTGGGGTRRDSRWQPGP